MTPDPSWCLQPTPKRKKRLSGTQAKTEMGVQAIAEGLAREESTARLSDSKALDQHGERRLVQLGWRVFLLFASTKAPLYLDEKPTSHK